MIEVIENLSNLNQDQISTETIHKIHSRSIKIMHETKILLPARGKKSTTCPHCGNEIKILIQTPDIEN